MSDKTQSVALATLSMDGFEQFSEKLLKSIVNSSKDIAITDIHDKKQVVTLMASQKVLREKRLEITVFAKGLRDSSNKFSKDVIALENERVDILKVEEERLKEEREQANVKLDQEERIKSLPDKRAKLDAIGSTVATDENLLNMGEMEFSTYLHAETMKAEQAKLDAQRKEQEEKAEKERLEQEEKAEAMRLEREALDKEKQEVQHQKEIQEAKEQAQKDAKEAAERLAQEKIEHAKEEAEKKVKDIEEKAQREKEEREQREKEAQEAKEREEENIKKEEAKLAKRKKYNEFLAKNEYKEGVDFKVLKSEDEKEVLLYKLVDKFTI